MARWTLLDFIYDQWSTVPPVVTADLERKTVVVTGANTGLGFEASKHFARMNPGKLILACRSQQREAALARMSESCVMVRASHEKLMFRGCSQLQLRCRGRNFPNPPTPGPYRTCEQGPKQKFFADFLCLASPLSSTRP